MLLRRKEYSAFSGRGGSCQQPPPVLVAPIHPPVVANCSSLTAAIEQTDEAVVITDLDARILYVNPAFTRLTGYNREEAIGKNPRVLKSGKQDPAFYKDLWQTVLAGRNWHGELINRRKDGTTYLEAMTIKWFTIRAVMA